MVSQICGKNIVYHMSSKILFWIDSFDLCPGWFVACFMSVVDPNPEHRYLSIHQENSNRHDPTASMHMPYDDFLKLIDRFTEQPKDLYNLIVRIISIRSLAQKWIIWRNQRWRSNIHLFFQDDRSHE